MFVGSRLSVWTKACAASGSRGGVARERPALPEEAGGLARVGGHRGVGVVEGARRLRRRAAERDHRARRVQPCLVRGAPLRLRGDAERLGERLVGARPLRACGSASRARSRASRICRAFRSAADSCASSSARCDSRARASVDLSEPPRVLRRREPSGFSSRMLRSDEGTSMLTTWSEDDDAEGLSAGSDFEAGRRKAVLVDEDSGSSGCEDDLDACWSSSAVKKLLNWRQLCHHGSSPRCKCCREGKIVRGRPGLSAHSLRASRNAHRGLVTLRSSRAADPPAASASTSARPTTSSAFLLAVRRRPTASSASATRSSRSTASRSKAASSAR